MSCVCNSVLAGKAQYHVLARKDQQRFADERLVQAQKARLLSRFETEEDKKALEQLSQNKKPSLETKESKESKAPEKDDFDFDFDAAFVDDASSDRDTDADRDGFGNTSDHDDDDGL